MKCEMCGAENPDNATFCSLCLRSFLPLAVYPEARPSSQNYQSSPYLGAPVSPQVRTTVQDSKHWRLTPGGTKQILGIEGMSQDQLRYELARGGRFIVFYYCISLVLVTFRKVSPIYFIKAGESHIASSVRYSLISCMLGWWGIPFGFIWTPQAILKNLTGGIDVTGSVSQTLIGRGTQGHSRSIPIAQSKPKQSRSRRILKIVLIAVVAFFILLLIIGLTQK